MLCIVELLNIKRIIFEFNNCAFIFINITIVRSTKNSDNLREISTALPPMHFIPFNLRLVSSNYAEQPILIYEFIYSLIAEKVRATSSFILLK